MSGGPRHLGAQRERTPKGVAGVKYKGWGLEVVGIRLERV